MVKGTSDKPRHKSVMSVCMCQNVVIFTQSHYSSNSSQGNSAEGSTLSKACTMLKSFPMTLSNVTFVVVIGHQDIFFFNWL